MRQYYSQEGSQRLPESPRQTDCLFAVGPDSRARCWLWSSVTSWSGSKTRPRKVSVPPFICLHLPDMNDMSFNNLPWSLDVLSKAAGWHLFPGVAISNP